MSTTYFAKDGNYGDVAGMTVVNTTMWTDSDFEMLDSISDCDRPQAARLISQWIDAGRKPTAELTGMMQVIHGDDLGASRLVFRSQQSY